MDDAAATQKLLLAHKATTEGKVFFSEKGLVQDFNRGGDHVAGLLRDRGADLKRTRKYNEELLSNLIPITAAHGIACSHRPFDFVWRFTVWTCCALRHFVRSLGRAVDLDA